MGGSSSESELANSGGGGMKVKSSPLSTSLTGTLRPPMELFIGLLC